MVVVGDDHVAVRELDLLLLLVGIGLSPARHEEQVEVLVELFHERFQAAPAKEAQPRLQPAPEMDGLVFALFDPPHQTAALEGELLFALQVNCSRIQGDIDRLPLGRKVPYR